MKISQKVLEIEPCGFFDFICVMIMNSLKRSLQICVSSNFKEEIATDSNKLLVLIIYFFILLDFLSRWAKFSRHENRKSVSELVQSNLLYLEALCSLFSSTKVDKLSLPHERAAVPFHFVNI
jgi:hypothetical protein